MKTYTSILLSMIFSLLIHVPAVADDIATGLQPVSEAPSLDEESLYDEDPQAALDRQFRINGHELSGVIVDRTVTMAGKTFYRAFSQLSIQESVMQNTTLTVREQPDARWGSQLWVMDGNDIYFRTQLSPRINEADRSAAAAINVVRERIIQKNLERALISDADLGPEEF